MSQLDKYLEIRDTIIRPALEELKEEYESLGYYCHIATQRPQRVISFSREVSDFVQDTVSIFLSNCGWVIFSRLNVLYSSRLGLDEITPERVKEKIREALG